MQAMIVSAAIVFLAIQAICEKNGREERLMMKLREKVFVLYQFSIVNEKCDYNLFIVVTC